MCIEKTPAPHVQDMWESGDFYATKVIAAASYPYLHTPPHTLTPCCAAQVIMANKGKDESQVSYAKAMKAMFKALQEYVKTHHRTGLEWNPKGGAASA